MKKTISALGLIVLFFGTTQSAQAQEADSTATAVPDTAVAIEKTIESRTNNPGKFAIILQGGAVGYGADVAYNINPHFNLRAGANFFAISDIVVPYTIDDRDVDIVLANNALSFELMAEYLPSTKSSFKLVGGVGYISEFTGDALVQLKDGFQFGDITLPASEVGEMNIQLQYSGIAPYLGLGFGRSVPNKRVGFGIELGSYYIGAPSVAMTATNLLEPTANEDQEAELEEAFDSLRWLPNIKLRLAIRL